MQCVLFPDNTRTNFRTHTDPSLFNYLYSSPFEVALKSITLENDVQLLDGERRTLAVVTNLSDDIISSNGYNKIICLFTISNNNRGILHNLITNPLFFLSNIEKLSKAQFKIVDLSTLSAPNFNTASPTFIELAVRPHQNRMKEPFHVLLDSSCVESKKHFPSNNQMEFCIQLPQRLEFAREDWMVCLKSIHMTEKLLCPNGEEFNMSVVINSRAQHSNPAAGVVEGLGLVSMVPDTIIGNVFNYEINFKDILPMDVRQMNEILNSRFNNNIRFSMNRYGFIEIRKTKPQDDVKIVMSEKLMQMLGLKSKEIVMLKNRVVKGIRLPNLRMLHPNHFLITSSICDESLLSGQLVQILKYFPNSKTSSNDHDFLNNDFVKLGLKNFDRIKIRISDLSGEKIKCEEGGIATRLLLLFVNMNS